MDSQPDRAPPATDAPGRVAEMAAGSMHDALLEAARMTGLVVHRRRLAKRQHLFRAGQRRQALYLVNAGFFKTSFTTADGRECITGFQLRGDILGLESLDMPRYPCDAVALETGEVWEVPCALFNFDASPVAGNTITAAMAREIRREWNWMLMVSTTAAEHRVAGFLLDYAARLRELGFSGRSVLLRMTRADLGNYLALKPETVVRAFSRLQQAGLIAVQRREIVIHDATALRRVADSGRSRACLRAATSHTRERQCENRQHDGGGMEAGRAVAWTLQASA